MSARPEGPSRRATRVLVVALVLLIGLLGVYGASGFTRVRQMRATIADLERDIVALRSRAEELKQTVDRLRNDPDYIEKLAREERGLVREGETVLKFPPKSK